MNDAHREGGSFRDPSGFLFRRDQVLYRQVNRVYRADYDLLMESGLYQALTSKGYLVPHEEVDAAPEAPEIADRVIRPEELPFISYPYEWSFSQLKDAALLTLRLEKMALERGMSLKDASAYNIQFRAGKPCLIDSLSFEHYEAGTPWVAYRQFCQHFLAPLALMAHVDVRMGLMLRIHLDGIPLDVASRLLPWKTRFNPGLGAHVHLHASAQKRYADAGTAGQKQAQVSKNARLGLIDSLQSAVKGLTWKPVGTEWTDYYEDTNYSSAAFDDKQRLLADFVERVKPQTVWDLGANTGVFSQVAAERGASVLAFDIDPGAVEKNYRQVKQRKEKNVLPLVMDLTNPSPSLGWAHQERQSLLGRGPADMALALALIHHLAISNNLPFERLADFFAETARWLVIEFVPKQDSQVQRLLSSRKDIFDKYDRPSFEAAFEQVFHIREACDIPGSERVLYLMESR
jgi:ribosomal protein L11 methylase PrmA